MGRDLDRGLEDRNERDRFNDSRKNSGADKVKERTRKELYDNLK